MERSQRVNATSVVTGIFFLILLYLLVTGKFSLSGIASLPGKVIGALGSLVDGLLSPFKSVFSGVGSLFGGAFENLSGFLDSVLGLPGEAYKAATSFVSDTVNQLGEVLMNVSKQIDRILEKFARSQGITNSSS